MKPTAIYIPELGKVFFIEEIESISDIKSYKKEFGYFEIKFKYGKKKIIRNCKISYGEEDDYYYERFNIKVLELIRNQFLQYTNIINAQETDKESLKYSLTANELHELMFNCQEKRFTSKSWKNAANFLGKSGFSEF